MEQAIISLISFMLLLMLYLDRAHRASLRQINERITALEEKLDATSLRLDTKINDSTRYLESRMDTKINDSTRYLEDRMDTKINDSTRYLEDRIDTKINDSTRYLESRIDTKINDSTRYLEDRIDTKISDSMRYLDGRFAEVSSVIIPLEQSVGRAEGRTEALAAAE